MDYNKIPQQVRDRIQDIIEKGDYEYADNYRATRLNDIDGLIDFNYAESLGCCGSHEEEIEVAGEQWIIGFNYGH